MKELEKCIYNGLDMRNKFSTYFQPKCYKCRGYSRICERLDLYKPESRFLKVKYFQETKNEKD